VTWMDDLSAAWEREYPDLDTEALPPLVRLARLAVLVEDFQQSVVAPLDLSPADYSVLAALRRAGPPYQQTPSKLYSRLQRSSGGMTKILHRLEERALIERAPDPSDGRGSVVSLTEKGLDLQERSFRALLAASRNLLAPLTETAVKDTDRVLQDLLDLFEPRGSR
jgi:DNA-binding MarR family transcriptional regulator